jgi:hypothetical protein
MIAKNIFIAMFIVWILYIFTGFVAVLVLMIARPAAGTKTRKLITAYWRILPKFIKGYCLAVILLFLIFAALEAFWK